MFKNTFIPRRLDEVTHFERDAARIASGGQTEGIYYQTVVGLETDLSGVRTVPALLRAPAPAVAEPAAPAAPTAAAGVFADAAPEPAAQPQLASDDVAARAAVCDVDSASADEEGSTTSSSSSSDSEGEDGVPSTWAHRPAPPGRDEIRSQRRENKIAVKEAQRERRKTKLPKHLKNKKVKAGSARK